MAINPGNLYPGKTAAPSADYPFGSARNVSTPGDGTGTPWEAALVNDLFGFQQALLDGAGLTPTGTPERVGQSQYLDALRRLFTPSGVTVTDVGGGSNVTLNEAEAAARVLVFEGELTANIAVIVPDRARDWIVINDTTGAFALTLRTSGGSGFVLQQGEYYGARSDGINVVKYAGTAASRDVIEDNRDLNPARVMVPGAGGLLTRDPDAAGDLNEFLYTGVLRGVEGQTTNGPNDNGAVGSFVFFCLSRTSGSGGRVTQTAYSQSDPPEIYHRALYSTGEWSQWVRVLDENDIPGLVGNIDSSLSLSDAIWSWWANPKLVRHNDDLFLCFADSQGGVGIAQYNYRTRIFKRRILSADYTPDDHNAGSIIVNDGGLAVFFGSRKHTGADNLIRYFVANKPDIDALGGELTITASLRTDYPNTYEQDGQAVLFHRGGGGSNGEWFSRVNTFPLGAWPSEIKFFSSATGETYIMSRRKRSDPNRILIVQGFHPQNVPEADIYVAELVANSATPWDLVVNGTVKGNLTDGSGLPVDEGHLERAYTAAVGEKTRLLDGHEQSIVFVSFTGDGDDGEYRYLTKVSGTWQSYPIVATGKLFHLPPTTYFAGVAIDDNDPFLLYVTREEGGVWYFEKWASESNGQTWARVESMRQSDMVIARPMAEVKSGTGTAEPDIGALHFIGRYNEANFEDYNTDLKGGRDGTLTVKKRSEFLEVGQTATFTGQGSELLLPVRLPDAPCQYRISVSIPELPNTTDARSLVFRLNGQTLTGELRSQMISGKGVGTDVRFSDSGNGFTLSPRVRLAVSSDITVFYSGRGRNKQASAVTAGRFEDGDYSTTTASVTWVNTTTAWEILGLIVLDPGTGVDSPIYASVTRIL